MIRFELLALAALAFQANFCGVALADPDLSIVRAVIDNDTAQVTAAGRTRVDLLSAVVYGLRDSQVTADGITVGPWLRLPKNNDIKKRLVVTVCVGGEIEGGDRTAYIGVTPKAPFQMISSIAKRLSGCGFSDVRLLSDETVRTDIVPMMTSDKTK